MKVALNLDEAQVADLYRSMVLIRRFEEAASRLYMQGKIRGFLHLYTGEEAIASGAISALGELDYVVSHYRDHGHALCKGMDPKTAMAELCGKATGSSGGRGGSMHLFDPTRRFMGGYAIVAGQMPIAVGLGLALKYKHEDGVVVCFFGDGAVNEGEFHESLNLASLWKLPVLFFLENNLYGMGSGVEESRAGGRDVYLSAETYRIPAAQIDGMDVVAIREATIEAIRRARSGSGPVFLEAMTYRFRGHSVADPASYRESEEVEEWRRRDPIESFKATVLEEGIVAPDALERIDVEVAATISEAVQFAEESPEPDLDSLSRNVYA